MNKNNSKLNILPYVTLGAGALGLYLRIWLYATGVDSAGLLRTDHPASLLLFILSGLMLLLLTVYLRQVKDIPPYKYLFPQSLPAAIGCMIAACGVLVSVFTELRRQQDTITLVSCVLGVLTAVSLVFTGICRQRRKRPNYYLHFSITAYLMIHLVSQYRAWSAEPQLHNYFFQLLASVFLMLCSYYRTLLDTGVNNRRRYVFFNYCAIFFCCLSLLEVDWLFYGSMGIWMLSEQCSLAAKRRVAPMQLPKNVLYCINTLEDAGFNTYVVGGCVRDSLLGLVPHDYDLCTAATPDQIAAAFSHHPLVRSGEKHGTIGVVLEGDVYEITTFRTEGGYTDSRHPDWVNFVTRVEEDLARRDFTVNAMAYSPTQGYIDPFGGRQDLKAQILRAVGDAETRFHEDALRILRGVRFSIRYRLTPEQQTEEAMHHCAPLMDSLARERVFSELCRLLPLATASDLIRYQPIITQIIPELADAVGFDQCNPHHQYDIYTHTAQTVEAAPQELTVRLAALLHDVGKMHTFSQDEDGTGHFYGHAKVSAEMADEILQRLRASNALRERVVFLISQHMTVLEADKKLLMRRLSKYGEEAVKQLLSLQRADHCSKRIVKAPVELEDILDITETEDLEMLDGITEDLPEDPFVETALLLQEICSEAPCLTTKDLAINGTDILALGVKPGPHIGQCMTFLLELVQDELLSNTKEALIRAAKDFFKL